MLHFRDTKILRSSFKADVHKGRLPDQRVGADRMFKNMKGYIYILRDSRDKFYIGSTSDIKRRLRQHELGHTQTTRNTTMPKVVLIQEVDSLTRAREIEKKLKQMKRKDFIEKIVADGYIRIAS